MSFCSAFAAARGSGRLLVLLTVASAATLTLAGESMPQPSSVAAVRPTPLPDDVALAKAQVGTKYDDLIRRIPAGRLQDPHGFPRLRLLRRHRVAWI